jgi:hypothetical protein
LIKIKEVPIFQVRRVKHVADKISPIPENLSHLSEKLKWLTFQFATYSERLSLNLLGLWMEVLGNYISVVNSVPIANKTSFSSKNNVDEIIRMYNNSFTVFKKILFVVNLENPDQCPQSLLVRHCNGII